MQISGILLWVVVGLTFCLQVTCTEVNDVTLPVDAVETARKMTKKQLATITKDFVHYYLYHGCKGGSNCGLDTDICFTPRYRNVTHILLSSAVNFTTSSEYSPRILQKNQVSWKPRNKAKPAPTTDNTTVAKINAEEEKTERTDKIHKHLVFALLLPHHPFSQEVRRIMTTAAPMFPQMTIVLGNAYDFKEMTSKYFITSFPKIMYFKTGMFIESFSDEYTVENVAAQLTEWSNALPSAVPIPFKETKLARITPKGVREFDIYAPGAQMQNGLSLQTLPLTAQYPLVDAQVPLWLLPYLPYARHLNNSAFIERRHAASQRVAATHTGVTQSPESATAAAGSEAAPVTTQAPPAQASGDSNTAVGEEQRSQTEIPETAAALPATGSLLPTTVDPTSATVPLVVTVTVPFPNMEPFLGSLENYAVWDTRVFLLAGVYTIARVFYLLKTYLFAKPGGGGGLAAAVGAGADGARGGRN